MYIELDWKQDYLFPPSRSSSSQRSSGRGEVDINKGQGPIGDLFWSLLFHKLFFCVFDILFFLTTENLLLYKKIQNEFRESKFWKNVIIYRT